MDEDVGLKVEGGSSVTFFGVEFLEVSGSWICGSSLVSGIWDHWAVGVKSLLVYGFGYIILGSPYTLYSIYLGGIKNPRRRSVLPVKSEPSPLG